MEEVGGYTKGGNGRASLGATEGQCEEGMEVRLRGTG